MSNTDLHSDDLAVDRFAAAMKAKLADARAKGRSGWHDDEDLEQLLSNMLRDHVDKGDPRDVANFCCFLWNRGERIAPAPRAAVEVTDTEIEAWAIRHGFDGWSATDRRAAFEDAQTWHPTAALNPENNA